MVLTNSSGISSLKLHLCTHRCILGILKSERVHQSTQASLIISAYVCTYVFTSRCAQTCPTARMIVHIYIEFVRSFYSRVWRGGSSDIISKWHLMAWHMNFFRWLKERMHIRTSECRRLSVKSSFNAQFYQCNFTFMLLHNGIKMRWVRAVLDEKDMIALVVPTWGIAIQHNDCGFGFSEAVASINQIIDSSSYALTT